MRDVAAAPAALRSPEFSLTAFIVMRSLLALDRDGRWTLPISQDAVHYARLFVERAAASSALAAGIKRLPDRAYLWLMDHCNVYGMTLHFALRKALVETTARKAIKEGITQIVILGAGFDSLALRLQREFPSVAFFEIDHPATQQVKRETVSRDAAARLGENIAFLPCDLSVKGALRTTLEKTPFFRTAQKSLFVLEGLSMYLTEQENTELFSEIRALSAPGSRIIFGALEPPKQQLSWLVRSVLAWRKESYRWTIGAESVAAWLEKNRYRLSGTYLSVDLQQGFRSAAELKKLAKQSMENYYLAET